MLLTHPPAPSLIEGGVGGGSKAWGSLQLVGKP